MRGGRKSGVIMRLIKAEDVKELINGLDSLPWEEEVDDLVNSLPTVEAEPVVHGKWNGVDHDMFFECSICGYLTDYMLTNFCPHCGAKMDGV